MNAFSMVRRCALNQWNGLSKEDRLAFLETMSPAFVTSRIVRLNYIDIKNRDLWVVEVSNVIENTLPRYSKYLSLISIKEDKFIK